MTAAEVIKKTLKIESPSDWGKGKYAIVGIELDNDLQTIAVHLLGGTMPLADKLFYTLLADEDIRDMIREYQEKGRKERYKIWSDTGMSGRQDVYISFIRQVGGFYVKTGERHLLHISGYGRLNEGFGDEESKMYIGDFVEVAVHLGFVGDMEPEKLLEKAGKVKYLENQLIEDVADFTTDVTKLL